MMTLVVWMLASSLLFNSHTEGAKRKISNIEIHAVVQAVQDEIYDYGFEEDYSQVGENLAGDPSKWESRMPIYIDPGIEGGEGRVIYSLMRYGEIYRVFTIRKDGVVILDGDPELEFPPAQPSRKTVNMNKGRVRQLNTIGYGIHF
jgi:hypothetical protein